MIVSAVYVACAAALWSVVARKGALVARHPRDPALWALLASMVFPALAFTLAPDAVRLFLDTTTGVPNLSGLVIYTCVLAYAGASRVRLLYWVHGPRGVGARPWGWVAVTAAAIAAMTALFAAAAVPVEATDFEVRYATRPAVAGFVLIYLAALLVAFGGNAKLYWRYARAPLSPWVRRGLRVNAVGCACLLGYGGVKLARVVSRWLGVRDPPGDDLGSLTVSLGALLLAAGVTMPVWGSRLAAGSRWVARYRAYHALYPLWVAVHRVLPHLALVAPRHPCTWVALRGLDGLLHYRPAVEIRDAYRELRPHMDRRVADTARALGHQAGMEGDDLQAVVEAAVLARALQARAHGAPPPSGPALAPEDTPGGRDAAADRRWLSRVSRAFARSVLVPQALDQAETGTARVTTDTPAGHD